MIFLEFILTNKIFIFFVSSLFYLCLFFLPYEAVIAFVPLLFILSIVLANYSKPNSTSLWFCFKKTAHPFVIFLLSIIVLSLVVSQDIVPGPIQYVLYMLVFILIQTIISFLLYSDNSFLLFYKRVIANKFILSHSKIFIVALSSIALYLLSPLVLLPVSFIISLFLFSRITF